MPVELVPRVNADDRPVRGGRPESVPWAYDGERDGASDLGRPSLVADHLHEPKAAWWSTCAVCGLGEAAHERSAVIL